MSAAFKYFHLFETIFIPCLPKIQFLPQFMGGKFYKITKEKLQKTSVLAAQRSSAETLKVTSCLNEQ